MRLCISFSSFSSYGFLLHLYGVTTDVTIALLYSMYITGFDTELKRYQCITVDRGHVTGFAKVLISKSCCLTFNYSKIVLCDYYFIYNQQISSTITCVIITREMDARKKPVFCLQKQPTNFSIRFVQFVWLLCRWRFENMLIGMVANWVVSVVCLTYTRTIILFVSKDLYLLCLSGCMIA